MLRAHNFVRRIVKRFRGGLAFKAHRVLYHSTLGSRVIKKTQKKKNLVEGLEAVEGLEWAASLLARGDQRVERDDVRDHLQRERV